ncbi:hypothetical protein WOLCODRAFT_158603 [Wolfiporia cocos MD-104 SS10]|uniref:F-box domain-containing protein n=1 Tax=Wolfiporia cocos (strain MD-104) TaxID=742152 RepID=A0A2H3JAZ6_WOLCO|nr:hypothetical protein WOLCODRAFT_158603 [Wolfiporia cocos MD-104 SS10]
MARSRTELNILPNLTTLEWQSERLRPSLLLMGSTVKHFTVRLPNGPDHKISNKISNFFEDIAVRMPSLTYLDLSFDRPVREIEIRIVHLLQSLHDLQKVVVPVYCLTSRVIECLSALPNLGTIQFEFMERQGKGDDLDVQHFSPTLEESAFPALWDLSFSSHLNDATRFIGNRFGPNNLTSLYVHVLSAGEPSSVHEFITTVSENCKLLTNLYIDQFLAPDAIDLAASRTAYRLTWEDLRPLLSCSKLTSFELRWDVPLNMSQSDIEELASRWPSLKVLSLNSEPMLFIPAEPSPLTLRALISFAQHCPNLRELGLYLSATAADLTHLNSLALPPKLQPFLRLRKFCVGLSSITEPGPAALFLSQLFPLGCEIVPGVGWPDGFGMPETAGNVDVLDEMQRRASEWYDRWVEVDRVLPMLTRLRLEEREKRNALEDEVEDLRLRCRLLEERKALPEEMDGSCLVV